MYASQTEFVHKNNFNAQDDVSISSPDGVPKVLAGDPHRGPRHADHHGHLVVQLECPVVNIDLLKGEIVLQTLKEVRHAWLDLRALQRLVFHRSRSDSEVRLRPHA